MTTEIPRRARLVLLFGIALVINVIGSWLFRGGIATDNDVASLCGQIAMNIAGVLLWHMWGD